MRFVLILFILASCNASKSPEADTISLLKKSGSSSVLGVINIPYDVNDMPDYDLPDQFLNCSSPLEFPVKLSDYCLYEYLDSDTEYINFQKYELNYPLWTNGSDKKRWMYLPRDSKINTLNPDEWIFPVGTVLLKEFSYNGLKVETRLIEKLSSNNWRVAVYAWNNEQTQANYVNTGVLNALGTGHEIPSLSQCINCHKGRSDFAIGPEAVQFEHRDKNGLNLDKLVQLNLITHSLPRPMIIKGNELTQKALGYLHGNCSHCHNPDGQWKGDFLGDPTFLNFRHTSSANTLAQENAYLNLFRFNKIDVNNPSTSQIIFRMRSKDFQMPPVGVQKADEEGIKLLLEWVNQL